MDLDELLVENEKLRDEVERLNEQNYRLRTSERRARESSLSPCEQVTLHRWSLIDRLKIDAVYAWRSRPHFPEPCATYLGDSPLYDLDALRIWKRADDERLASHREKMLQLRLERGRVMNELCPHECS